jgi:hypothetical protein
VFYDEFSIVNRPTLYYGWAKRNTKFRVLSNEKNKRERKNGLISVDATTGEEYIKLTNKAKTEDVADYFYNLVIDSKNEGYNKMTVILDNNPTHKDKMRYMLWLKMRSDYRLQDFKVEYINTPAYSPDFNLAEYMIHLLRLKLLHHLPSNLTLNDIEEKISNYLSNNQLQNKKKVRNTINRIYTLGGLI